MSSPQPGTPPGHYYDPATGQTRWWTGKNWSRVGPTPEPLQPRPEPQPNPINGWGIVSIILGILAVLPAISTPLIGVLLGIFGFTAGMDGLRRARLHGHGLGVSIAGIVLNSVAGGFGLILAVTKYV